MSSKIFSLKKFIFILIFLKVVNTQENLTQKNTTIYLNYTSYFINSTIRTLSDKNFDTIISLNNNSYDFLILFTLRRCPNCNNVIKITENVEKYYKEKNAKIKFYKVDCYLNQWTAMRFNAFKIPIYIYIKQGFYASFNPSNNYTEKDLINFIEDENKEFIEYPGRIGYIDVCKKIVHNITLKIQKKIIFWNDLFTLIVILGTFFGFLYFEIKIYKAGCCGNKNNNVQNVPQNKNILKNKSKEKSNKNGKDKIIKEKVQ